MYVLVLARNALILHPWRPTISATCSELGTGTLSVMFWLLLDDDDDDDVLPGAVDWDCCLRGELSEDEAALIMTWLGLLDKEAGILDYSEVRIRHTKAVPDKAALRLSRVLEYV